MSSPKTRAFVGLGANLGNPAAQLAAALDSLDAAGVLWAVSGVYRSAPVGPPQPRFWNLAAELLVADSPYELLARCQALEATARRQRWQRWGPRTLDVDVLFFGDVVMSDPELEIPHPRLRERRFVLEPLAELAPELVTAGELAAVADQDCERVGDAAMLRQLAAEHCSGAERLTPRGRLEHRRAR
ncbi:2-amino-4-hydroxy-6-hydroxymethyldihydropteridine diphosphokinase [Candidatus Poriferisodalis sp.]|uniref:2-amino-4-hydroxy-6- hydroxymethyldihydropteridine diphosphokinase n=1 Tax=Candidatus Poriferisodalis sp. TaxID=3101277 RepID=UPI003B013B06